MFYDKFMYLCNKKGVAPSRAAMDAGISKSLVTKWKSNRTQVPSPEILQKLSAYFSLPVSVLLSEEEMPIVSDAQKETPDQLELTEGEKVVLDLFRQIPKEQQPVVFAMIKAALGGK